jgi:hypothetical protein
MSPSMGGGRLLLLPEGLTHLLDVCLFGRAHCSQISRRMAVTVHLPLSWIAEN